jgi:hypothetical protein
LQQKAEGSQMNTIVAAEPDFTVDSILDTFTTTGSTFPREAMQWALGHWEDTAPRLLSLLQAYVSDEDQSEPTEAILFFALHLLAEKRETRAFPALCHLLRDPEQPEFVLGDAVTTTLTGIIINTFDGDVDALRSVIEGPDADVFVRSAALDALSYLAQTGCAPAVDMRSIYGACSKPCGRDRPASSGRVGPLSSHGWVTPR